MASWCPSVSEAVSELEREVPRYLECVETIREECGHDPNWTSEGEWLPEPALTVPADWNRRQPVASAPKSFMPNTEDFYKAANEYIEGIEKEEGSA